MATVKSQSIPSDLYESYLYCNRQSYTTGFNYYDSQYGYIPLHVVGKQVPKFAKIIDKGLGNAYFRNRAMYRYAAIKTAEYWNNTRSTEGVIPPYTGMRSKKWWTDNTPLEIRSPFNYYFKISVDYLKYKSFAPFHIDQYFYVADNGNKRVIKYDCNNFTEIIATDYPGQPGIAIGNIEAISVDENFLFICDNTNKCILCFNKNDFEYVNKIDYFSESKIPFGNLKDILSDGKYLYICDSSVNYLIKQSIIDTNDFKKIMIERLPGEEQPALNNIHSSFDWLYVYDLQNKRLGTYYKPADLIIRHDTIQLANCPMCSTLFLWAIGNNETKIITLYAQGMLHPITTIGQGAAHNFNFQAINGFCISGNLLLVLDSTSQKLFQISLIDYSLVNEFDITGLFSDVNKITAEPQNYFYIEL
jgi:hypothetical protein